MARPVHTGTRAALACQGERMDEERIMYEVYTCFPFYQRVREKIRLKKSKEVAESGTRTLFSPLAEVPMVWWAIVLTLFGSWILCLAAGFALGGAVHGLFLAGLAIALARTWQGRPFRPRPAVNPRRGRKRSPSNGDRPRAGRP